MPAPDITEFPNVGRANELMIVGPITVRSACSHFVPRDWQSMGGHLAEQKHQRDWFVQICTLGRMGDG